jgi:putative aldouronate transport system permease protein
VQELKMSSPAERIEKPAAVKSRTVKLKITEHFRLLKEQKFLLLMSVPFFAWVIVFRYLPLWGWTMAFQNYKPGKSFFSQTWVGLKQFQLLFADSDFYIYLRNTIAMSVLEVTVGFVVPIIFALMLNEIRNLFFKKTVQTISYLPHFISWVVAANMISIMLSTDGGIVNEVLLSLRILKEPVSFMGIPQAFWFLFTGANLWKEVGWNAIIYLAAIAGVDQELYDAVRVDGAGRLRRIWHVTIPGIRSTIIVIFIMNIGWMLSSGFERQFLLGNALVQKYSWNLDLYALYFGLGTQKYSFGTAVNIFQSVVSVILVFAANRLAKRIGEGQLI